MADARLVATNPEDSSLVAVACTPEGLLKTEGGTEGPQGPKGDQGPEGPQGPDGEGVPEPYGKEGSYLWIKDGAPAWTESVDPLPPDPSLSIVFGQDSIEGRPTIQAVGPDGIDPSVTDYDAFLKTLDCWTDTSSTAGIGLGQNGNYELSWSMQFEDCANCVCSMWLLNKTGCSSQAENYTWTQTLDITSGDFAPVRMTNNISGNVEGRSTNVGKSEFSFLITRPSTTLQAYTTFNGTYGTPGTGADCAFIHSYSIVPLDMYLLDEQIKQQKRIQAFSQTLYEIANKKN